MGLIDRAELVAHLTLDDDMSAKLKQVNTNLTTTTKQAAAGVAVVGAGVGTSVFKAIGGFTLLDRAISATIGLIGDSAQAFRDDQASVVRLTTALTSNVQGWDGNTTAIEKVIAARMRLGFTDEDQRNSLAILTAATGDVSKALDIQRVAMDLARLKGIELGAASDALTKVEAGSFRILKSLGIELADNATQEEALTAVRKVAEGQAAALAATEEGKLLYAQIRVEESTEKMGKTFTRVGGVIIPVMADIVEQAATGFDKLVENTEREIDDLEKIFNDLQTFAKNPLFTGSAGGAQNRGPRVDPFAPPPFVPPLPQNVPQPTQRYDTRGNPIPGVTINNYISGQALSADQERQETYQTRVSQ